MRRTVGRAATAAMALASIFSVPVMAGEALDGFWMDSDGEVILQIGPCGNARCGRVAWLRLPLGGDGLPLLDYRNPDPALRSRPVCGLDVVSGFKKQPDGIWGDGTVYVSDLGMSFSGYAEVLNPTQVKVTGYVGLSIFGASEVWSRVATAVEPCWTKPAKSAATPAPKSTTEIARPSPNAPTAKTTGTVTAEPAR